MNSLLMVGYVVCMVVLSNSVFSADVECVANYRSPTIQAHVDIIKAWAKSCRPLSYKDDDDAEDFSTIRIIVKNFRKDGASSECEDAGVCSIPSLLKVVDKFKLKLRKKRRKNKGYVGRKKL